MTQGEGVGVTGEDVEVVTSIHNIVRKPRQRVRDGREVGMVTEGRRESWSGVDSASPGGADTGARH